MDKYTGLSQERFKLISSRYEAFLDSCADLSKDPIKVFDPLPKKSLEELQMIKEVSKQLQKKKDEDVKRAAQATTEEEKAEKVEEKRNGEVTKIENSD